MVRIDGQEIPYSTRYYASKVRFMSAVGLLIAREVEGGEAVSLDYNDPSDEGAEDTPAEDEQDRKLGAESVHQAMSNPDII
jgi:hypothetical protein